VMTIRFGIGICFFTPVMGLRNKYILWDAKLGKGMRDENSIDTESFLTPL
jgi:hypothetical protein